MLTRYVFINPMVDAEPNEAHYALAELQRIGK
jgi:NAD-dependent SIR2 family protein deacetylase